MKFAGVIIDEKGVRPNPDRLMAIRALKPPTGVPSVRSYLGMVNQLQVYIPELAQLTEPIRGLLRRDIKFQWLPAHQEKFDQIKQILTSDLLVSYYDISLTPTICTDASSKLGLAYVLFQFKDGKARLIEAGSRSLTATEKNWASCEVECLALVWALLKCLYISQGQTT